MCAVSRGLQGVSSTAFLPEPHGISLMDTMFRHAASRLPCRAFHERGAPLGTRRSLNYTGGRLQPCPMARSDPATNPTHPRLNWPAGPWQWCSGAPPRAVAAALRNEL